MADETEEVEIVLDEADLAAPEPKDELAEPVVEAAPEPEKPKRARAPKQAAQAAPEPSPEPPKVIEPEEGLEELKRKLEASESARQQAEARSREADQRATQAQGSAQDSRVSMVENAITTVKTTMQAQKGDYAQALAEQDYAKAADIQANMSTEAARLLQLETGLEQLKNQPKPQAPIREVDPVEALAGQLDANSAAWVRSHPNLFRDQNLYAKTMRAHEFAIARYAGGTPEYLNEIERLLGLSEPVPAQTNGGAQPVRQVQPSAAPVSRAPNGAGSPQNNVIRLSADERETAHSNWPDLAPDQAEREYAKQKRLIMLENGTMQ